MTDHKFTDDDVIKTLKNAKYKVDGVVTRGYYLSPETFNAVVDLIGRQKAEIESLQAVQADMTESLRLAAEANKDMQAEIERLESLCEKIGIANDAKFERICVLQEDLETAKSEAVKEFAERLKANMSNIARMEYGGNVYFCVGYDLIDSLVKEMTEESK